jgi:uncharacterized protein YdhG (YjbR/CyaY superfamily)
MAKNAPENADAYIASFPEEMQVLLEQLRATILKAAPGAEEVISYGMPAYKYHGMLVYFAGWKNHIGFYAMPSGNIAFAKELSKYQGAKGSVQFPADEPLPLSLVTKIVKFRMKENIENEQQKVLVKAQKKKTITPRK